MTMNEIVVEMLFLYINIYCFHIFCQGSHGTLEPPQKLISLQILASSLIKRMTMNEMFVEIIFLVYIWVEFTGRDNFRR